MYVAHNYVYLFIVIICIACKLFKSCLIYYLNLHVQILLNCIFLNCSGSIGTKLFLTLQKLRLLSIICLSKPHPLGCLLPPHLIYEGVHDPHAVPVDDKPNSSGRVGKMVRGGRCQSRKIEDGRRQEKDGLDDKPDATFSNKSLEKNCEKLQKIKLANK